MQDGRELTLGTLVIGLSSKSNLSPSFTILYEDLDIVGSDCTYQATIT